MRLFSPQMNQEIVYVAEASEANNNQYKFDLDVSINVFAMAQYF